MLNTDKAKRLAELEKKWLSGTITEAERQEYAAWYNDIDENSVLEIPSELAGNAEELRKRILGAVHSRTGIAHTVRKGSMWRLSVAAAAVAVTTLTCLYLLNRGADKPVKQAAQHEWVNDAPPGHQGAFLLLADGTRIMLDSNGSGRIADQGKTRVLRTSEGLTYQGGSDNESNVLFNTLVTPRARQFNLTLPDGSKLWMNAESSVRFPVAFNGKSREIEFEGEGYFEVAPAYSQGHKIPFVVNVNGRKVEVLGTHFNIMAYDNEAAMETTLLEGSVKVINGTKANILKPGQQASSDKNGKIRIDLSPDIDKVIAWKSGKFVFDETNIRQVMRQLTRWYDVEVEYVGDVLDYDFSGGITRYTNVSEVLKMLELTGALKFRIENKKVIVTR